MLAAGMNEHVTFGDHSGIYIEQQVIAWLAELLGFPKDSGGILVSSGSVANLTALVIARDSVIPGASHDGLSKARPPVLYASNQIHNSIDKAAGIIGVGRNSVRRIAVDDECRIIPEALERAIAADRASGNQPFCVVGSAGTVNTGAIDDLVRLREIADRERLWFHIDAAIGAPLAISPALRSLVVGMESADSIGFDLHKWFHVPYDVGCVLVRDQTKQRTSFSLPADYLLSMPRGVASRGEAFGHLGPDLSRSFRALKVWFAFKEFGARKHGELVEQNVAQARYLAKLVDDHPLLERLAPAPTNVVCFRYRGTDGDGLNTDELNREIVMRLQESGVAVVSYTRIRDRFAIRVAITNHRSRRADFGLLVRTIVDIGMATESSPQRL